VTPSTGNAHAGGGSTAGPGISRSAQVSASRRRFDDATAAADAGQSLAHRQRPQQRRRRPRFGGLATLQRDGAARADALYVVRIAAQGSGTDGRQLAQRADVRLETAVNFVNACCALGYLTTEISG
jgi:hypothetical protein